MVRGAGHPAVVLSIIGRAVPGFHGGDRVLGGGWIDRAFSGGLSNG